MTDNNQKNKIADLTVVILTYNEEKHIERCILSIKDFVKKIIVIDSNSNDKTLEICKKYNVEVFQKKFINLADKLNWALENAKIDTHWILRLDADEILEKSSAGMILEKISNLPEDVGGLTVNLHLIFLGKRINFGGVYPQNKIRIWKNGSGKSNNAWQDEHIIIKGKILNSKLNIIDENLNNIDYWIDKHNDYSTREAISFFLSKKNNFKLSNNTGRLTILNKFFKFKIYYNLPIIIRSFLFFVYRYIFRLGFLNGWQGLTYHFLQGFWFRFLVDVKVKEIKKKMITENKTFDEVIKSEYNLLI